MKIRRNKFLRFFGLIVVLAIALCSLSACGLDGLIGKVESPVDKEKKDNSNAENQTGEKDETGEKEQTDPGENGESGDATEENISTDEAKRILLEAIDQLKNETDYKCESISTSKEHPEAMIRKVYVITGRDDSSKVSFSLDTGAYRMETYVGKQGGNHVVMKYEKQYEKDSTKYDEVKSYSILSQDAFDNSISGYRNEMPLITIIGAAIDDFLEEEDHYSISGKRIVQGADVGYELILSMDFSIHQDVTVCIKNGRIRAVMNDFFSETSEGVESVTFTYGYTDCTLPSSDGYTLDDSH